MTWPFCFLASLISIGVTPCSTPLTITVAPIGEDVTGILCALLRVSVAQFGASRALVRVRKRNRAAFFLHMGPSLSHTNIYPAKRKVVKVVSILEMEPGKAGLAGVPHHRRDALPGGEGMKSQPGHRNGPEAAVNAVGTTISARKASGTGASPSSHMVVRAVRATRAINASSCGVCLQPLPPGAGAKYCSSRCRQMNYWLTQIQKALHDGLAEGIRPRLVELGRRSS